MAGLQRTVQVQASDVVPLSEASLRSQFHPPERYRLSIHKYEPGTRFDGAGRTGRLYVLAGACSVGFDGQTVLVQAGQMLAVPEGDRTFAVVGEAPCQVANVWDLAELAPALFGLPPVER